MTTTTDKWNWLEWIHHTSKDMALHTATSYQDAHTALLKASYVLAEAWEDGYFAGRDDEAKGCGRPRRPNPYKETA